MWAVLSRAQTLSRVFSIKYGCAPLPLFRLPHPSLFSKTIKRSATSTASVHILKLGFTIRELNVPKLHINTPLTLAVVALLTAPPISGNLNPHGVQALSVSPVAASVFRQQSV